MLALELTGGALVLALLLVLAALGALIHRRRTLSRRSGAVEVCLRLPGRSGSLPTGGRGWMLGIGVYSGEGLGWFRVFSLAPRPRRTLDREGLEVLSRRSATRGEAVTLGRDGVVLDCRDARGPLELGMSPEVLTGFLAWWEARHSGKGRGAGG